MNFKTVHRGRAEKGHFIPDNEQRYKNALWALEGKRVIHPLEKEIERRTRRQNSFYWVYLTIIADDTGHTTKELHELFKMKFITPEIKVILGEETAFFSTTNLEVKEFSEYIEKISALTGIPPPYTD